MNPNNICRIFAKAINRKVFKLLFQTKLKTFIFSQFSHFRCLNLFSENTCVGNLLSLLKNDNTFLI